MVKKYELAIVGGGAAGLFSASLASGLGVKTCLIEKRKLGGDCTWFGCVPSKALLRSAQAAQLINDVSVYGLGFSDGIRLNVDNVMSHARDVINEIARGHSPEVFEKRGVSVIMGAPQFQDEATLSVNDMRISAQKYIICTGSHPFIPSIEGLEDVDYVTNETIFSFNRLPQSIIVLGGGPIGVELAQALARLGVKVSIVEMMDTILIREEKDIAGLLHKRLCQEGVTIITGKKAVKFEGNEAGVSVTLQAKDGSTETLSAQSLLVAVGRAPNTADLGLNRAGVDYNNKGIMVNEYLQTSNKRIFAAGDVVGPYQFSHVAAYQASVAVRNALFRKIVWQKVNYRNVAWATFTDPEIAHLGLGEEEARAQVKNIKVYTNVYAGADRAVTDREKEGMIKIITDRKGRVLGAHIAGAKASEIMQGLIVAKALNVPLAKLASLLYIYPTLSELVKKTAAKSLFEKAANPLIRAAIKLMRKTGTGPKDEIR